MEALNLALICNKFAKKAISKILPKLSYSLGPKDNWGGRGIEQRNI